MDIQIYNKEFVFMGVIDGYESVIWRPAYQEIGDFEIYVSANNGGIAYLEKDFYLVRQKDISVDSEGNVTFENVMIYKNIKLQTDPEEGDYFVITGKELKFLMHQRIIWNQTNLSGTAEEGIRLLVDENAINPTDENRIIPLIALGTLQEFTDSIDKQITGDYLDEAIVEICKTYQYGWKFTVINAVMYLIIYQGEDRSFNTEQDNYVVFSDEFDNISETQYEMNSEGYANTSLIGGEGEGSGRTYATVGEENIGIERFESFVDAKSISQNIGSEDEITSSDYLLLLQEKGKEKLSELAITEGFSGEIKLTENFIYGKDFFLGDIVTVMSKYGISKNVRVLSSIEAVDTTGERIIPQLNI